MTIDPAVQAARLVYDAWSSSQDEPRNFDTMVAVMTTVLPLIRAQAFSEAADTIRSLMDRQPLFDERDTWAQDVYGEAFRAVRGLGER